jgi:hypothetical protein
MPLVAGDDLFFIYSCRPTVVMRYDPQGRRVELASQQDGPPLARDFRGGSQAIEVEDGYLFVVHESVTFEDGGRVCPHRFVLMRHDFEISHVSPQFFFCGRQLEFCAGLARRGTLLVASFGVRDAQAYVATMELGEVLSALRPVGRLDP